MTDSTTNLRPQPAEGVVLESPADKYTVNSPEIDCAARMHLCHAACCKLEVLLSRQDLMEGIVESDPAAPHYMKRHEDRSCLYACEGDRCAVYPARPATCRGYSCKEDRRIWIDFEKRIINPDINEEGWPKRFLTKSFLHMKMEVYIQSATTTQEESDG